VRDNLDVLTADESLATAEIRLAQQPKRAGLMAQRLSAFTGYAYVVVDCAPSLSLLNQNALCFADSVLVPVSCDYLSLVGVKQVMKVIKHVHDQLGHPVTLGAILPTMYDVRAKVAQEALRTLREHFGDRTLPPVRVCVKVKEAPMHRRTIFEYAPDSTGARDYAHAVDWALTLRPAGTDSPGDAPRPVGGSTPPAPPASWPTDLGE
jgi:chromosome partitioning protein